LLELRSQLCHQPESRALLLPHQRLNASSCTLFCSVDAPFGSPPQMATDLTACGLSTGQDERGEHEVG
jgi:hypothetical protein